MRCYYCNNDIRTEVKVKEFKFNGNDKTEKRVFCSGYCEKKWEESVML